MTTRFNSDSELKNRTARVGGEQTRLPRIDFSLRVKNRGLSTGEVLELMFQEAPALYEQAEVVGGWIWIAFDDRQPPTVTSVLSQFGFHWNPKRHLWQHPCGKPSTGTVGEPRAKYGSYFPAHS